MAIGVSIVVCCYNSAKRLPVTLQYLSALQLDPAKVQCEIIVVNNASTDDTEAVAWQLWQQYGSNISFSVVAEPTPGLTAARQKGIAVSQHDYILFCDDDNWLDAGYLVELEKVIAAHPEVAMVGGLAIGEFESAPGHWLLGCTGALAIGPQAPADGFVNHPLYGAGLVMSKTAYLDIIRKGFVSVLSDRKGNVLVSGGDTELCHAFICAGYKLYYNSKMHFRHFMPAGRMNKEYIMKLCLSGATSGITLSMYDEIIHHHAQEKDFYKKTLRGKWHNLFYYGLRTVAGKYKFYSKVNVLHALRSIRLLMNRKLIKNDFEKVYSNLQKLR